MSLNYEKVLDYSIKEGFIKNEIEIKSLCDGCDDYPAYFSANTAFENCDAELGAYNISAQENVKEYDLY